MAFDPKSLLTPPSILFPLIGAGVGYLLGRTEEDGESQTNGWAILAGALGGALFNSSSVLVSVKSDAAKASGATSFNGNVGGEAVAAIIGSGSSGTATTAPAQATTGPFVYIRR